MADNEDLVKHISHIRCISAYRRLELLGALAALSTKERVTLRVGDPYGSTS